MPAGVSIEPSKLPLVLPGLIGSKNTKQNKALQSLKRQSVGRFSFARINSCTYRLDRPDKLGAGCLMEVGWPGGARQQWIARVGNRASEPFALAGAKRTAVAMLRERKETDPSDRIAELNKIAATEFDRVALAKKRKWKLFPRLRKDWRKPQGIIFGKRCGVTQNIGPAARGS